MVVVFVDTPLRLGRGQVGSANIAGGAVYSPKIATHAVGSGQQGTITLARSFGTVANLSIGSYTVSYGSAGTFAARKVRARALYLTGSIGAGTVPAARVSTGTLARPSAGGGYGSYGSVAGRRFRGAMLVLTGSMGAGTVPAARVSQGTFGASRIPLLQSLAGTAGALRVGTLPASKVTYGTFGVPRIPQLQSLTGTANVLRVGSLPASKITYGTFGVPRIPQLQSLTGSIPPLRLGTFPASKVTAGTFARSSAGAAYGSYGTHAGPLLRGRYGSWSGTQAAPVTRGRWGSFSGTVEAPRHMGQTGSYGGSVVVGRFLPTRFLGTALWGVQSVPAGRVYGSWNPPPARARFLSISVDLKPGVSTTSRISVIQSRFSGAANGTIAHSEYPQNATAINIGVCVSCWVFPRYGSYKVGTKGASALSTNAWIENDM